MAGFEIPPEVVALGLVTGLTYALLGVGIVVVYRSARVLNFAHGEMGAMAAGLMPVAVSNWGWNYWPTLILALAAGAAAGAFTELVVMRKLAKAPRLIVMVATIGVSQLFFAIGAFIPKEGELGSAVFPTPFDVSVTIGRLRLTSGYLMILLLVPLLTAGLALFFRYTRLGLASRAAAENADAAALSGVPIRKVSLAVWVLAGLLAAGAAILLGPTQPVVQRAAVGPALMLRGLAAAMLGGLANLPRVFAAGVAIGVVELIVAWNYPSGGVLELVLFIGVLGSLLLSRRLRDAARGGSEGSSWSLAGALRPLDPRLATDPKVRIVRRVFLAGVVLAAFLTPLPASNATRVLMTSVVLFAVMGLSLVVLTGYAGQISLGQFAFVGLGAVVGGRMNQLGYPPGTALLYAVLAGGVAALIVGLPALRIRGLFLAVTTLGFAVAAQLWLFQQRWLVNVSGGRTSLEIPRPELLGIDFQDERNYYWLCLVVLILVAAAVYRLRATGVGRAMMAVRDNEPAAATLGVGPRQAKLTAFVLAGMIGSLAGYLYGGLLVSFTEPNTFAAELSLALVALVVLGGVTTVTGAILGALWIRALGYVIGPLLPSLVGGTVALLVGGVGLLVAILQFPGGLASVAFRIRDRVLTRVAGGLPPETPAVSRPRLEPADSATPAELVADDIVVRFGGNIAVDHVCVRASAGQIVGLVGPNGAGKTTLFDVLSGHLRPDEGRVLLNGTDVTRLRPEDRAAIGMGRTFQQARLFGELSLRDTFKVALESKERSEIVPSILGLPPSRLAERNKTMRADEVIDLLGLGAVADHHVAELSTGTRRLAELGCMVGLGARLLLLDEPTAGIAQREVEAFRPVLQEIRDHLGATIMVIEHDIPLIMGLVDRLYVLAAGHVIAEGHPSVLRDDAAVVAAYLGTDEQVIARSGEMAMPRGAR